MEHTFWFKGDFKELKKLGFEFAKYYASNYIGYTFKASQYSEWIVIWKKHKDITLFDEIDYEIRPLVFSFIKDVPFEVMEKTQLDKNNDVMYFNVNKKELSVISTSEKIKIEEALLNKHMNKDKSTKGFIAYMDEKSEIISEFSLSKKFIKKVKELIELGYIELEVKGDKKC